LPEFRIPLLIEVNDNVSGLKPRTHAAALLAQHAVPENASALWVDAIDVGLQLVVVKVCGLRQAGE
jgi:hypothetical protein